MMRSGGQHCSPHQTGRGLHEDGAESGFGDLVATQSQHPPEVLWEVRDRHWVRPPVPIAQDKTRSLINTAHTSCLTQGTRNGVIEAVTGSNTTCVWAPITKPHGAKWVEDSRPNENSNTATPQKSKIHTERAPGAHLQICTYTLRVSDKPYLRQRGRAHSVWGQRIGTCETASDATPPLPLPQKHQEKILTIRAQNRRTPVVCFWRVCRRASHPNV